METLTDTLYFDGNCPICVREIRVLNRHKRSTLVLQDVHTATAEPDLPPKTQLLLNLHLKAEDGSWLTGPDATLRAWSHTPFGWVFKPLAWPVVRPLALYVYDLWARARYRKLYGCSDCLHNGEDR